jgi:capsular polysaccharide biosynthesis protein
LDIDKSQKKREVCAFMETNNSEEIEIDLKELFYVVFNKIWLVVLAAIVCSVIFGVYTKVVLNPTYQSTIKLYIINKQDSEKSMTYSDLQTGSQLTKDYQILVTSRTVTEQVIKDLNLNITYDDLSKNIAVNNPEGTRILEITVTYTDPDTARKLADDIGEVSAEKMVTIMGMEKANIVETANMPGGPSSPNVSKNIFMGGLIGIFLSVFAIFLIYTLDDSIKKADDIERLLNITTLGTIPLEHSIIESRKLKALRKKAYKKYKGGLKNAIN